VIAGHGGEVRLIEKPRPIRVFEVELPGVHQGSRALALGGPLRPAR